MPTKPTSYTEWSTLSNITFGGTVDLTKLANHGDACIINNGGWSNDSTLKPGVFYGQVHRAGSGIFSIMDDNDILCGISVNLHSALRLSEDLSSSTSYDIYIRMGIDNDYYEANNVPFAIIYNENGVIHIISSPEQFVELFGTYVEPYL